MSVTRLEKMYATLKPHGVEVTLFLSGLKYFTVEISTEGMPASDRLALANNLCEASRLMHEFADKQRSESVIQKLEEEGIIKPQS